MVLDDRVSDLLGGTAGALQALATAPPAQAVALRAAYGDGIAPVFGIAAVASLITLVRCPDQGGPAAHHDRSPAPPADAARSADPAPEIERRSPPALATDATTPPAPAFRTQTARLREPQKAHFQDGSGSEVAFLRLGAGWGRGGQASGSGELAWAQ